MPDKSQPGVLGSLPRTRPHRRSDKRAAAPKKTAATPAKTAATPKRRAATPKQPATATTRPAAAAPAAEVPRTPQTSRPLPPPAEPPGPLETAVQAAAELAEIGLHAGARALRGALSRLPHP
jgi:hypothetical protein